MDLLTGTLFIPDFVSNPTDLFESLFHQVNWDSRMNARKTASFGVPYNYSQITYPAQEFLPSLETLRHQINNRLGFLPNNCLINLYPDGHSRMGFHADQIDILEKETGVVIVSLGETRNLVFRKSTEYDTRHTFSLSQGSLFYMTQEVQVFWQHAIPRAKTELPRMSLTFRKISV